MHPVSKVVSRVDWQFFSTLTFKGKVPRQGVQASAFFALLRTTANDFGVHFKRLLWVLRFESGEVTGREHLHALIAGLPAHAVSEKTCFAMMSYWERLGGGMARIRVYDPSLGGVDYIVDSVGEQSLRGLANGSLDSTTDRSRANSYEVGKFGGNCEVMFSHSMNLHLWMRLKGWSQTTAPSKAQREVNGQRVRAVTGPRIADYTHVQEASAETSPYGP